ncbi:hypothetical protein [Altibacter sp. HG106]|uniref:hypothetical protein n=1 Tax=Altibacter sp. HG106 TaxID=3023937 RepID=UPI0023509361|nr:hypothetical protein [Altibacter sp. HG106]MDC7994042.1 hypothetical protein [Altibacter sp. HG106]
MSVNHIPFKDYNRSNEVLHILYAAKTVNIQSLSKIGIQKIFYLANLLSPVKEIVLATIRFVSHYRGPYSKEIQNTVDHLTALGYVEIEDFIVHNHKYSIAKYSLSDAGESVVNKLVEYSKENEKQWWYSILIQVSNIYSNEEIFEEHSSYDGFDHIVDLVYKDSTYLSIKNSQDFRKFIDTSDPSTPTYKLIEFVKKFIVTQDLQVERTDEKRIAELVIISFFEFLYSKYIDEFANG